MSPESAFFSSSSRSICSTSWRSCFCAETCSDVMDLPPLKDLANAGNRRMTRTTAAETSLAVSAHEAATLAATTRRFKPPRPIIQRYLARGLWHGTPAPGATGHAPKSLRLFSTNFFELQGGGPHANRTRLVADRPPAG